MRTTSPAASSGSPAAPPGMSAGGGAWRWQISNCACAGAASVTQATNTAMRREKETKVTRRRLKAGYARGAYAPRGSDSRHNAQAPRFGESRPEVTATGFRVAKDGCGAAERAPIPTPSGRALADERRELHAVVDCDHLRRLFANHDRRRVGVSANHIWHD